MSQLSSGVWLIEDLQAMPYLDDDGGDHDGGGEEEEEEDSGGDGGDGDGSVFIVH